MGSLPRKTLVNRSSRDNAPATGKKLHRLYIVLMNREPYHSASSVVSLNHQLPGRELFVVVTES